MRIIGSRGTLAAACVLGLAIGIGEAAHAGALKVLPGCWGAGTSAMCEVTLYYYVDPDGVVYTYEDEAEVCTGTCQSYNVPGVGYDPEAQPGEHKVCVGYDDRAGSWHRDCYVESP